MFCFQHYIVDNVMGGGGKMISERVGDESCLKLRGLMAKGRSPLRGNILLKCKLW